MKPINFLGNSLECLREFPEDARHDAGYQLDQVQRGKQPIEHAFQKKTRTTSSQDIEIAKTRFTELIRGRR